MVGVLCCWEGSRLIGSQIGSKRRLSSAITGEQEEIKDDEDTPACL